MTIPSSTDRKYRRSPRIPLLPSKHKDFGHTSETGFDGASFSGAVFNLSTTIVGAGIMALPATFKQLGLISGLVMILLGAALTESSIDNFAELHCDVLSGTWTEDGVHHSGVMEEWFGEHWWTSRTCLLLLTTLFVFTPLISFKRVDSLRYTSALSVALAVVFVAITAGVTIVKLIDGSIGMPRKLVDQASFWKLFTTIPVLVTAYICHHNVHPIENELKDPTQMRSIVRTSLTLCSSVYIATSFFGVLLFGDHTLDDVLANFDGDLGIPYSSLLDDVVRVSYGLHLMLVFPIVFFSLRLNVDGLLFPYAIPITFDNRRFILITTAMMGFIFVGAEFIPSIWDAFQVTGATAAVSVGFIFTAAIVLRDTHGIATKKDRLVSWLMFFLQCHQAQWLFPVISTAFSVKGKKA